MWILAIAWILALVCVLGGGAFFFASEFAIADSWRRHTLKTAGWSFLGVGIGFVTVAGLLQYAASSF